MVRNHLTQHHHSILIIGGAFAGLSLTHRLLSHTLPLLPSTHTYTVTLLTPNTQFYWKVGAPRALINPSALPEDRIFLDIAPGLDKYGDRFVHVQGIAVSIDPGTRTVAWVGAGDEGTTKGRDQDQDQGTQGKLHYTALVLATGTLAPLPTWSLGLTGETATKAALHAIETRLSAARHIVVAGGGATGVEVAGELCGRFPGEISTAAGKAQMKKVTLLSGGETLLGRLRDKRLGKEAEAMLIGMGVRVIHGVRIIKHSTTNLPDSSASHAADAKGTLLNLSDGSQIQADVFIDATGERPSTAFVPAAWLDDRGYVKTVTSTLRLDVPGKAADGVYVLGSVGTYSNGSVPAVLFAYKIAAESIRIDLMGEVDAPNRKVYEPLMNDMQIVPVGPGQGVATTFGWKWPSCLVGLYKGRDFNTSYAKGFVTGKTL